MKIKRSYHTIPTTTLTITTRYIVIIVEILYPSKTSFALDGEAEKVSVDRTGTSSLFLFLYLGEMADRVVDSGPMRDAMVLSARIYLQGKNKVVNEKKWMDGWMDGF